MRYNVLAMLFAFCLVVQGPVLAGEFFLDLPDVPRIAGFVEVEDEGMAFDTAQGRVAEVVAVGQGFSTAAVISFYRDNLPAFGWVENDHDVGGLIFVREGEKLRIVVQNEGDGVLLQMSSSVVVAR